MVRFYLDAQFKHWAHEYRFLSHFSFLLYGLSVLAVTLAWQTPAARLLTLTLATALYAVVAWQYLSLVPLYLMLFSAATLYALLVLNHFPADEHFLWSLPGFAAIFTMTQWVRSLAAKRLGAYPLALWLYRLLIWGLLALACWSLCHAQPSLVAMASALILAAGLWWTLKTAPGPLLGPRVVGEPFLQTRHAALDLRNSPWLYSVILAVTAGAAFAPFEIGPSWALRFSFELIILAWLWTGLAVHTQCEDDPLRVRTEILANSALLSVFTGLALAVVLSAVSSPWNRFQIVILGGAALALLWLSISLQLRFLFYAFLVVGAGTAALSKLAFFPGPSAGAPLVLAGLGVWTLLWWLERQSVELVAFRRTAVKRPLTLLWVIPLSETPSRTGSLVSPAKTGNRARM